MDGMTHMLHELQDLLDAREETNRQLQELLREVSEERTELKTENTRLRKLVYHLDRTKKHPR